MSHSPQRSPQLSSSDHRLSPGASNSSILSAILDEDSRQNGSADDVPTLGIWKTLIVPSVLNGMRIDKFTPLDWIASHTIGLWYASQEKDALKNQRGASPISSNLIPWGACLPVRVVDWNEFAKQPVGRWLKLLPKGTHHPYLSLLFYQISEPDNGGEDQAVVAGGLDEGTRSQFDDPHPVYGIDLSFPIELADISGPTDARLPNKSFFRTFKSRENRRLICNSPTMRPSIEAWHVMYSGEVIELGMGFEAEDLVGLDNDPTKLDRFGAAYVRALLELMQSDRPDTSINVYRACVSRDYWNLRRQLSPAEFRAADARTRLIILFAIVYLARTHGFDSTPAAKRLESALVRFVRSEFELGWSTETSVLDLLNCHKLDTGRVPSAYTTSVIVENLSASTSSSSFAPKPSSTEKDPIDSIRSHIISAQPTTREDILRSYAESLKSAQPSFGPDMDQSLPDLCALSAKRDSKCNEGIWFRNAEGTVVHRKGAPGTVVAAKGESFVLADGYPVRFYYVRNRSMKGTAYTDMAAKLHERLGAGRGAPELKGYTVGLVGGHELVVYPSIVVKSLAALRIILGQRLTQASYHKVPFGELWCTLPAFSETPPQADLSLLDPQPSIQNTVIGIRTTLMTNIVREKDGQNSRYAYSEQALTRACDDLRKLYVSGNHPTATTGTAGKSTDRLLAPSVYWLRPADEVSSHPIESLPEDTRIHLQALPRVDRFAADTDQYGTAMVLAYRDVPFLFSEETRNMVRTECSKCVVDYKGRFEDYMRGAWGVSSPVATLKVVERVISALFHAKPLHNLLSGSVSSSSSSAPSVATVPSSTSTDGLDLCGTNGEQDAGPNDTRDEMRRIAEEFESIEKRRKELASSSLAGVEMSMMDAMVHEGGYVTANQAFQAKTVEAANKQFRFKSLLDELKVLDPMLDMFRRYPDRFIQATWERSPMDPAGPKTSIHRNPAPDREPDPKFPTRPQKKGDWFWIDRHTDVGGLGPFTLLGYTYCFMAGRCGYVSGPITGEASNKHYDPNGVKIADIIAVKTKNKEEKSGSVAFVGELIELVNEASKRLAEPCESFTAWWRRLVEPLFYNIRHEEEAKAEEDARAGREPPSQPIVEEDPKRKKSKGNPDKPAVPNTDKDAEEIQRWWDTSVSIEGLPATYLRECRGMDMLPREILECSPFLRFLDPMPYKLLMEDEKTTQTHSYPCLLVFCVGKTGHTGAVQRIYLGRKNGDRYLSKADLPQFGHGKNKVKLTKGALKFDSHFFLAQPGRIELWPFVYLSEGPEKALAVAACSRYAVSFATLGVSRYDSFEHFKDADPQPTIIIAGDADHTIPIQQAKIDVLKKRGWKRVLYWLPHCDTLDTCACKDASDVLVHHGLQELRRQLGFKSYTWLNDQTERYYEPPEKEWRRYEFLKKYTDH